MSTPHLAAAKKALNDLFSYTGQSQEQTRDELLELRDEIDNLVEVLDEGIGDPS